jgi:cellulose synthase/poly-beta-1,6-N-acetylglucosamine synthase-like glycosyltransferase
MIYISVLYPALIGAISKFVHKKIAVYDDFTPEFTIILSAYNEEKTIARAIESIFSSNYPADKIRILVGSDGSTDATREIVSRIAISDSRVKFVDFDRMGKNLVLNRLLPMAETDIVLFMDADHRPEPDAFRKLLAPLADPTIGGTIPYVVMTGDDDSGESAGSEGFYQRYEAFLRDRESKIKTTINSIGIYSARKKFLEPIPNDYVCDDLFNVFTLAIKRARFVYVADAVVKEARSRSIAGEMKRRVRLSAGGISAVISCARLFNPLYGWSCLFFVSHKVSRYFLPLFLIALIACSAINFGADSVITCVLLWGQILFYATGLTGFVLDKSGKNPGVFKIPLFVLTLCTGFAIGMIRVIMRGQNAMWETVYTKMK